MFYSYMVIDVINVKQAEKSWFREFLVSGMFVYASVAVFAKHNYVAGVQ